MFKHFLQLDTMDCGPSCLIMIAGHYGKKYNLSTLRDLCHVSREGVSLLGISEAAQQIGFKTRCVELSFDYLRTEATLPCIIHWAKNHFIVVYKITNSKVYVADPAVGKVQYSIVEFQEKWTSNEIQNGFALLLEPTPIFYKNVNKRKEINIKYFLQYVKPFNRFFFQLLLGLIISSCIQLIFPFLTQIMVDKGIDGKNVPVLILILSGQLMLTFASIIVHFMQSWIVLYVGTHINVTMVYDFLQKLIQLPINYFDTRMSGDILHRIADHSRIEEFATHSFLNILMTIVNFLIFSIVLVNYSIKIFLVFLLGSLLYIGWISVFLRKRWVIDYERFSKSSENHDVIIQLVRGMQEVKLNNCDKKKISSWITTQKKLFDISIKSLKLNQYQDSGSTFINSVFNIIIIFIAALSVINGEITFGMMLAIQSIIGQLSGPVSQLVEFIHVVQDTKIGLERISDVYDRENEIKENEKYQNVNTITTDIVLNNISFQYNGPQSPWVIKNLSLHIQKNKITAIVGMSGSGKTTLLKLLLGFYAPTEGHILVNGLNMRDININQWRDMCGAVMQEGFIFSDTIANNIVLKEEKIDKSRLKYSCKISNIQEFINSLPLEIQTKIGSDGMDISNGQKQRLLIARAVYKNPEVILFDEATNSLDANNEKIIIENLHSFLLGKTTIIVAHRLSTVKNADQIVVLNNGKISECGTHKELITRHGEYFKLIKNQLELDD